MHQGVLNPTGSKQVRNQVYNERKKLRISKDEMHSTVLVAHQLDDYVRNYTLYPDFECVIGYTGTLDELNTLVSLQTEEPVLMGYNTTFNVSNNFVSTLVFKHGLFEGANLIPAAFLIHDRKKQSCHELFLGRFSKLVPNLQTCKGLLVANIQIFYCWNYLRQDLKSWLETHNASRDDKDVYREDFQTLLHSNSKEEFNTNEAELKLFWTDLMVEYVDKHYRNDILNHAVKLLLHE